MRNKNTMHYLVAQMALSANMRAKSRIPSSITVEEIEETIEKGEPGNRQQAEVDSLVARLFPKRGSHPIDMSRVSAEFI